MPSLPGLFPFAIAALAALSPVLAPIPATAQTGFYQASFAGPVGKSQLVAKDLLWACAGDSCIADRSNSRPAIVCSALARAAGPLTAFAAGGDALGPEQLARCNGGAMKTAAR